MVSGSGVRAKRAIPVVLLPADSVGATLRILATLLADRAAEYTGEP